MRDEVYTCITCGKTKTDSDSRYEYNTVKDLNERNDQKICWECAQIRNLHAEKKKIEWQIAKLERRYIKIDSEIVELQKAK